MSTEPDLREPLMLYGDDGRYLLADTEEQARAWAAHDDPDCKIVAVGWMRDVGWNAYEYETKAEFERESGLNSWWEGCPPPADEQPTEKCRLAFEVNYRRAARLDSR